MTNVVREIEQEALQKGREKGREEGRKEGGKETLARNIRSMNQKGESDQRIADLPDISVEEVRAYLIN